MDDEEKRFTRKIVRAVMILYQRAKTKVGVESQLLEEFWVQVAAC